MKSSSPSSSSPTSTSPTADTGTPLVSSSSTPPPPRLSLQSPELQAEFLKEFQNKSWSRSDFSDSSVFSSPSSPLPSPFTPSPSSSPCSSSSSSPSLCHNDRQARLSLSSPELLSELRESRKRPLRHVPAHKGLTIVFSGRGRGQASDSSPTTKPANQRISH